MKTCSWAQSSELMKKYHDKEWGIPIKNDQKLFEFLMLESAQAGLSWATILNKRENYRKAYQEFEIQKVAKWSEKKITRLMENPGIIRNEKKIRAAKNNAQCFLEIQNEFGSFTKYQWQFVDFKPIINQWNQTKQIPAITKESEAFAKDLKKRGFKFLGPTTVYAHMQACGMVNDHLVDCPCYEKVAKKMRSFKI